MPSIIAAGKREWRMVWTRVVAAEMKRNKEIHLYLEVEPTAPAEGPTVDRIQAYSKVPGRTVCSTLNAGRLPMHFSKGTDG